MLHLTFVYFLDATNKKRGKKRLLFWTINDIPISLAAQNAVSDFQNA